MKSQIKPDFDVRPGQIREFTAKSKGMSLVFVYDTEGVRADVMYSSGKLDSVFAGWLSKSSCIISEVCD